jgi:cysteinyl-tRNA synthetase
MNDDLNIGVALAKLYDFVREVNALLDTNIVSQQEADDVVALMTGLDSVIGVVGVVRTEEVLPKEAEALIIEREDARKSKDWKKADEIRLQLKAMGVVIEDTKTGVRWRLEKKS